MIKRSGFLTGEERLIPFCDSYSLSGEEAEGYPFHVLDLDEIKEFIKSYKDVDFKIIRRITASKIRLIERKTKLSLSEKTCIAHYKNTPKTIWLPIAPLIEVQSVVDKDGDEIEHFATVGEGFPKLEIGHHKDVTVTYTCGYGEIPEQIYTALLSEISSAYKHRNDPNYAEKVTVNGLTVEAYDSLMEGGLIRAFF